MMEIVFILCTWTFALVAWLPMGAWLLNRLGNPMEVRPVHGLILAALIGAAVNASVLGVVSIWLPINFYTSVVVALLGLALFRRPCIALLGKVVLSVRTWPYHLMLGGVTFLVISLIISGHTSLNNDSGLYYIQFIKWMNSYPAVPGLANLHDRLGFNSHWHLLTAAFNLSPLVKFNGNDLNGLLFVLISFGSLESASNLKFRANTYDLIWVLFPLPFFLLLRFLTSAAPDLPSTLIPLVYFSMLTDRKLRAPLPILALLLAFATTIKVLSVLHVVALLPVIFCTLKHDRKKLAATVVLVALVISPWLMRNVIQTGYLVFPMESIDLFSFDWKVPNELAANARKMVGTHARFGNYDLANYGKPMDDWIRFWFANQSKSVLMLLTFVCSAGFLLLAASVFRIDRNKDNSTVWMDLFLALTVLLSVAFWWISGPNPRFIYGIVFFFFAYALAVLAVSLNWAKWVRSAPLFALLPILAIARTVLNEPGPTRPTEFATMQTVEGTIYYPTTTDKCWTHELPCANMDRNDLEFRGNGLADGFLNSESAN